MKSSLSRPTELFTAVLCPATTWLSDRYMYNIKFNLDGSLLPTTFFLFWSEADAAGQLFFIRGMIQVVFILKQHQTDTWAHATKLHSLISSFYQRSDEY